MKLFDTDLHIRGLSFHRLAACVPLHGKTFRCVFNFPVCIVLNQEFRLKAQERGGRGPDGDGQCATHLRCITFLSGCQWNRREDAIENDLSPNKIYKSATKSGWQGATVCEIVSCDSVASPEWIAEIFKRVNSHSQSETIRFSQA